MPIRILLVDDDRLALQSLAAMLRDAGYSVDPSPTVKECFRLAAAHSYALGMLDLMMPAPGLRPADTKAGYETGIEVARRLIVEQPAMQIVGISQAPTHTARDWFQRHAAGLWNKSELLADPARLVRKVEAVFNRAERIRSLRTFIVHGHDHDTLAELRGYLVEDLKMPAPTVLTEVPWRGRTIIEKLESCADTVDVAFVLMTPDDLVSDDGARGPVAQARPNVLLELGYFLGRMARRGGRTIILMKGGVAIPTDLAGVGYIDVSNGIRAAQAEIYRELSAIDDGSPP